MSWASLATLSPNIAAAVLILVVFGTVFKVQLGGFASLISAYQTELVQARAELTSVREQHAECERKQARSDERIRGLERDMAQHSRLVAARLGEPGSSAARLWRGEDGGVRPIGPEGDGS